MARRFGFGGGEKIVGRKLLEVGKFAYLQAIKQTTMILLKFLCCLDANYVPTKKYRVESQAEAASWEAAEKIVTLVFEQRLREGWKVEYELAEPVGATYSTPADSVPLTVHKISKDGKKLWASYDRYEPDGTAETGFKYWNENLNDETQWDEYHLKTMRQGHSRWVRKGAPASSWPLHVGYRRKWWSQEF